MRYIEQFKYAQAAGLIPLEAVRIDRKPVLSVSSRRQYSRDYQRLRRRTAVGRREQVGSALRQNYKLSLEQYEALYLEQHAACAICHAPIERGYSIESTGKRGPRPNGAHVDHDHACCPGPTSCGRCVRGLLCAKCNNGIACLRDSPVLMRAAVEYLERSR